MVNCSFCSKKIKFFFSCNFFQLLVIKALDPDWIRIRIRIAIQPKMLDSDPDPDPDEMNADPQPWTEKQEFRIHVLFAPAIKKNEKGKITKKNSTLIFKL